MPTDARLEPYRPDLLPPVVQRYLEAHQVRRDGAAALEAFAADARVVDEDVERVGTAAIREWLTSAASQYTYTTTLTGQAAAGDGRWVVGAHLEGDFPGGVADLRLRFRVEGDRIAELVIAP